MMTLDEVIRCLRNDPRSLELVRDSYLDANVLESAEQFRVSAEFGEVRRLLGGRLEGACVLDLGAGNGIASYAFAHSGTRRVYAVEPNPSAEAGRGAICRLVAGLPIDVVAAVGENIPLTNEAVDVVYTRQVLHHVQDLASVLRECARVLKHGGLFMACREHVVDDERQLAAFLRDHAIHRLAGGENAFPLDKYVGAIRAAGLELEQVFGPWDTVINAFPAVKTKEDLECMPRRRLQEKLGPLGGVAGTLPGVSSLVWLWIKRPLPGRMYSFLAEKP